MPEDDPPYKLKASYWFPLIDRLTREASNRRGIKSPPAAIRWLRQHHHEGGKITNETSLLSAFYAWRNQRGERVPKNKSAGQ